MLLEQEAAAVEAVVAVASLYAGAYRRGIPWGMGVTFDPSSCCMNVPCTLEWVEDAVFHRHLQLTPYLCNQSQTANANRLLQDIRDAEPCDPTADDHIGVVCAKMNQLGDMSSASGIPDAVDTFLGTWVRPAGSEPTCPRAPGRYIRLESRHP